MPLQANMVDQSCLGFVGADGYQCNQPPNGDVCACDGDGGCKLLPGSYCKVSADCLNGVCYLAGSLICN
jgi:hypothetical protein